jgi:hypothetical protein
VCISNEVVRGIALARVCIRPQVGSRSFIANRRESQQHTSMGGGEHRGRVIEDGMPDVPVAQGGPVHEEAKVKQGVSKRGSFISVDS